MDDLNSYRQDRKEHQDPGVSLARLDCVSIASTAFVIAQALLLAASGFVVLWWSDDLMTFLIHMVGDEEALGAENVIRMRDGGVLLTNPGAMIRWTIPIWVFGMLQFVAAGTLVWLSLQNLRCRPAPARI